MAKEIIVPHFGTSVDTVTMLTWNKTVGDQVQKGDVICEVETDKSALEIESFYDGVLLGVLAGEGAEVKIGEVIAYVGAEGEAAPEHAPPAETTVQEPAEAAPSEKSAAVTAAPDEQKTIMAMPKVRKLSRKLGVDLAAVKPTGSRGEVTESDVKNSAGKIQFIELSKNQRAVAARIKKSYDEIIPISLTATINVRNILLDRDAEKQTGNKKPAFDAYFVKAVSRAMEKYPRFQYYFKDERLYHAGGANIGVAVGTDEELFIPVIKGDVKNVTEISGEIRGFQKRLESKAVRPGDLEGGVFLISNLGMYPVDSFTVIIPPGYSGALSIGRVRKNREPLIENCDSYIDEQVVSVTLAVDHRFINGKLAAQFLEEIKNQVEEN